MKETETKECMEWPSHLDKHCATRPIRRISLEVYGFDSGGSIEHRVRERDGWEEGRGKEDLAGGG